LKKKVTNMNKYMIGAGVAAIAFAAFAYTQVDIEHNMPGMETPASAGKSESTKAFEDAMAVMMKDMMTPPTGVPDVDFMKGMIPHHEGAIAMANAAKKHVTDSALLKLADDIVKAQESEIAFMKGWLAKTDPASMAKSPDSIKANEAAMATMMKDMMTPYTGNADLDFVRGMIPHHQGAIDAAEVVLKYGSDPEVKSLAEGVIKAQQSEIEMMMGWLEKHTP
jgi:uncharacterized protein (DUF305 family)